MGKGREKGFNKNSSSTVEIISSLYSLPFKSSAIASNQAYKVLTPTNEQFVRTISYQLKNLNTNLNIIDLSAIFEAAKIRNNHIARQLNIEFSGTASQVKMPQKVFRKVN